MGKFGEWAKRNWAAIIPLSIAGGIYYFLIHPKGEEVRQDADGILTAEEEKDIAYSFLSNEIIKGFTPALKGFVNDFDAFAEQEFSEDNLPSYRFSSRLSICWECWLGKIREKRTGYSPFQSTIYVINSRDSPMEFVDVFQHETGHAKAGIFNFSECPSTAYAFYSMLKMYSFNRDIGSLYIDKNFSNFMYSLSNWSKEEHSPYAIGLLNFLIQSNKQKGNLEKAVDGIFDDYPWESYTDEVEKAVSAQGDPYRVFFNEFSALIQKSAFRQELEQHMTGKQAEEYIDFLHIINLENAPYYIKNEQLRENYYGYELRENFINKYKDMPDFNPYFMKRMLTAFIPSKAIYPWIEIAQKYAGRFYPDNDFRFREDEPLLSYITPFMAQFAGRLELEAAMFEVYPLSQNTEEYKNHLCESLKWFSIMVESSCTAISSPELNEKCAAVVSDWEYDIEYAKDTLARYSHIECSRDNNAEDENGQK